MEATIMPATPLPPDPGSKGKISTSCRNSQVVYKMESQIQQHGCKCYACKHLP